jgi:hypothetical protein
VIPVVEKCNVKVTLIEREVKVTFCGLAHHTKRLKNCAIGRYAAIGLEIDSPGYCLRG